ncbi:SgrR family transcriptional regulator [Vibrio tapetis]|uniref:Putative ABC-type uncharacterized transport system, periplasmic component n=1 Tax=Vibrio tapetis subsp. tapetis TaxID=1671868 RepID=A0A2N8ZLD5_9VIBR|nr:SgrR family transcriptional regulator [Vibrio tapetis]SON52696.1 putative ABC-type uncharacterized transport system, periplasmic component [Vibrio tapetis subsp. tapetis]
MNELNLRRIKLLTSKYSINTPHETTLDLLEEILMCSRRNISNIMRKLTEINWVTWSPSVGRSKTSSLSLNVSLRDALMQTMQEELSANRTHLIVKLLERYQQTALEALSLATEANNHSGSPYESLFITDYPKINTLNPLTAFRHSELQIIRSIYDTLLAKNANSSLQPRLAHDWAFDGKVLQLWIRRDINTHTGQRLSTLDVIASLDNTRQVKGPVQYLFSQIKQMTLGCNNSILIELNQPNPLFPYALTVPCSGIALPEEKKFSSGYRVNVGTGPFKVNDWAKNKIVLEKHGSYFGQTAILNRLTLDHKQSQPSDRKPQASTTHGNQQINSFSYICGQHRIKSQITHDSLKVLLQYLSDSRSSFTLGTPVNGMSLTENQSKFNSVEPPRLNGQVVIAEPKWTMDYLLQLSRWVKQQIQLTGVEVQSIELKDVSNPRSVKDHADLLLIEEVIEQPKSYGYYEWLITSSCPRFLYNDDQFKSYLHNISNAAESNSPDKKMLEIEQKLTEKHLYTPLFLGINFQNSNTDLNGVYFNSRGYNSFEKLWVQESKEIITSHTRLFQTTPHYFL